MGISECEFWNMTLAEFNRLIESKQRVQKVEAQEKATYDYILADLVGRSLASMRFSRQGYGVGFHALLHTKKLQT